MEIQQLIKNLDCLVYLLIKMWRKNIHNLFYCDQKFNFTFSTLQDFQKSHSNIQLNLSLVRVSDLLLP